MRRRGAILNCFDQRTRRDRLLSRWPLDELASRVGAPVVGISRTDLHAVLAEPARRWVQTSSEVTDIEDGRAGVRAVLSDGRVESGDALIGADGIWSLIRKRVLDDAPPRPVGLTIWRANLPLDEAAMPETDFVVLWGAGAKFVYFRSSPGGLSWEAVIGSEPGGHDPPGESKRILFESHTVTCLRCQSARLGVRRGLAHRGHPSSAFFRPSGNAESPSAIPERGFVQPFRGGT